jgi:hypothetical protein
MQVAFVVIFATCTEVLGSIVWGVYTYRLGNLPSFVPPGHGLVYIGGMALAAAFARRSGLLTGGALLAVVLWGIVGLTALPRTDVGGAVGCVVLAAVLLLSRNPTYAGVFVVVALLEIFGTAIGTWTWAARVPGIGIENGNPPSGVGSGYVLFDVLATGAAAKLAGALPFGSAGSFGRRAPEARRQPGGGAVLRTISRSCSGSSSAAR